MFSCCYAVTGVFFQTEMYEEVLSFTAYVLSFTSPVSGGFTWSLLACLLISVTFVLLLLYLSSFFTELLVPEMVD